MQTSSNFCNEKAYKGFTFEMLLHCYFVYSDRLCVTSRDAAIF